MIYRRRQTITLYTRWIDPITRLIQPIRRVFTNASWDEEGNTIARTTGQILTQDIFIRIFWTPDLQYIPIHQWLAKSDIMGLHDFWSVDMANTTAGRGASIVVDHEINFEFEQATVTTTTQAENAFILANPGSYRVTRIDDNNRGTIRTRHISIRANRT